MPTVVITTHSLTVDTTLTDLKCTRRRPVLSPTWPVPSSTGVTRDTTQPDVEPTHTLKTSYSTSSVYPRKLSPGLAARLELLDRSNKNKGPPSFSRSRNVVGRIPAGHIQQLDRAHKDLSIRIQKRGQFWNKEVIGLEGEGSKPLPTDKREPWMSSLELQRPEKCELITLTESVLGNEDMTSPLDERQTVSEEDEEDQAFHRHGSATFDFQQADSSDPEQYSNQSTPDSDDPPPLPPKDHISAESGPYEESQSYFNPFNLSRTNSIYSLSRVSFNSQLSQLTSLNLPQASSLSASISAIPTAPAAVKALISAAEQMRKWIHKATEVLGGLNAEDDIEWAAAGGREGLDDVDTAVGKFESLVSVYVQAIEELQLREDIADASAEGLETVVAHMEKTLKEWEDVKTLLRGVKEQVELAMEWEELWSVVLGDVGMEMDNLSRLIFEMEEKRHKTITADVENDTGGGMDINELETIVEESPSTHRAPAHYRFSLPPAFAATSPADNPNQNQVQDDSNLLALFARMQPLRASLDFLPMRLSMFQSRAQSVFPTACEELESRRKGLEKSWKRLETDAEALRRELGEDRWILVFRNAGRQAQKMCESVERSVNKLQEAIDAGHQQSNPSLTKKVESFEAKKMHYGSAIERVLAIIQKGVNDRLTVNGEILRLHQDMRTRWAALAERMQIMDETLEAENAYRHQQLRDSLSSIVSMDRSAATSTIDTPGSSPASSIVMSGGKGDPRSRRGSNTGSGPGMNRRYASMPPGSAGSSHLPRLHSAPRAVTTASHRMSSPAPSPHNPSPSVTPRPSSRLQRPSANPLGSKPRWNSSPNTKDLVVGHNFKPLSHTTPSPYRKALPSSRTPRSSSSYSSIPLPSPLSRETATSPAPSSTSSSTRRQSQLPTSSPLALRAVSPSPGMARSWSQQQAQLNATAATHFSHRSSLTPVNPPISLYVKDIGDASPSDEDTPIANPQAFVPLAARPVTALANSTSNSNSLPSATEPSPTQPTPRAAKRMSMLPQPKNRSGRDSTMAERVKSGSWALDAAGNPKPAWR